MLESVYDTVKTQKNIENSRQVSMRTFDMVENYAIFDEDQQVQEAAVYNGGAGEGPNARNDPKQFAQRVEELFDGRDRADYADETDDAIAAKLIKDNPSKVLQLALHLIGSTEQKFDPIASDGDYCDEPTESSERPNCGYMRVNVQNAPG